MLMEQASDTHCELCKEECIAYPRFALSTPTMTGLQCAAQHTAAGTAGPQ